MWYSICCQCPGFIDEYSEFTFVCHPRVVWSCSSRYIHVCLTFLSLCYVIYNKRKQQNHACIGTTWLSSFCLPFSSEVFVFITNIVFFIESYCFFVKLFLFDHFVYFFYIESCFFYVKLFLFDHFVCGIVPL